MRFPSKPHIVSRLSLEHKRRPFSAARGTLRVLSAFRGRLERTPTTDEIRPSLEQAQHAPETPTQ